MRFPVVAGWAAALAAGSVPVHGEPAPPQADLQVRHHVTQQGNDFLVGAEGTARLPDGILIKLELIPLDESGREGDALRVGRVSVQGGRFQLPPWAVPRGEIHARQYRLEASVSGSQPPALERLVPPPARRWQASVEIALGDARAFCRRLTSLALAVRMRWVALSRHRVELRTIALSAVEGKLSRADWKAWTSRGEFARTRSECLQALDSPLMQAVLPSSRRKAHALLAGYDMVIGGVSSLLQAGSSAKDDASSEFVADFKISDFATSQDDLLGFDTLLADEGALLFVSALDDIAKPLDPGASNVPKDAPAGARKDLQEILEALRSFYAITWTGNVQDMQKQLLDAIETARRLVEASAAEPPPDKAEAQRAERTVLWTALRGTLGALRGTLQARVR